MDYFIDLDQTPFHQWQLELLIESFRYHNLQDNLVVCLNETFNSPLEFNINSKIHKRIIKPYRNIGKLRGYNKLNAFYNIHSALKEGLLKQPFCKMPIDCVLFEPMSIQDYPIISFQVDPDFTPQLIIEKTNLSVKEENWPSIGEIVCFNNIPIEFFQQLIYRTEQLAFRQAKESCKIWEDTDRLSLNLKVQECVGQVNIQGVYTYQSTMYSNKPQNFICYKKGFLPIFEKKMFSYEPPHYFSFGNPFKILSEHFPSGAFYYMSTLAKNYLNRQKRLNA